MKLLSTNTQPPITSVHIVHHVLYCTLKSRGQVGELCCLENNVKFPYHIVPKSNIQYFVNAHVFRHTVFGAEAFNPSTHCTQALNVGHHTKDIFLVFTLPTIPVSAVYHGVFHVVLLVIVHVFVPLLKSNHTIFVAELIHHIDTKKDISTIIFFIELYNKSK